MGRSSITVVIPAYNEEKNLPACLTALNNQSIGRDAFDVIVIDNNSSDNTTKVAERFGAKVILESTQGNVNAFKKGMESVRSEIAVNIDADTIFPKDGLALIDKAFEDPSVIGVTGTATLNISSMPLQIVCRYFYSTFLWAHFLIGKPHLVGFCMAVRTSAYRKAGGVNMHYRISADVDLGLRMKKFGKMLFLPNLVVRTSARRWQESFFQTIVEYTNAYIHTVWLRKPAAFKQKVVR